MVDRPHPRYEDALLVLPGAGERQRAMGLGPDRYWLVTPRALRSAPNFSASGHLPSSYSGLLDSTAHTIATVSSVGLEAERVVADACARPRAELFPTGEMPALGPL